MCGFLKKEEVRLFGDILDRKATWEGGEEEAIRNYLGTLLRKQPWFQTPLEELFCTRCSTRAVKRVHAGLWRLIYDVAEDVAIEQGEVLKVKGHATDHDVQSGQVEAAHRRGNASADALADLGARCHPTDEDLENTLER